MKLWAMLCREIQDRWVMVESFDKMWSTREGNGFPWWLREGNGKPLQHSCLENSMNSMKRQKDRILKDELPRSVGAQYATREEWRNSFRKKWTDGAKEKQHPVMDVTGDGHKVWCCESATLNSQETWKTQQWPQDWKRSVCIPIPKKGNAKESSNYHTIALISQASKIILKILQTRL